MPEVRCAHLEVPLAALVQRNAVGADYGGAGRGGGRACAEVQTTRVSLSVNVQEKAEVNTLRRDREQLPGAIGFVADIFARQPQVLE